MTEVEFTEHAFCEQDDRTLETDKALAIIDLFEGAKNWRLSPQFDGCFENLQLAREYLTSNPGKPLMIVITRPNNENAESFLVHFKDERFYLEDDSMGGLNGSIGCLESIPELGTHLMTCKFGDNACHSF